MKTTEGGNRIKKAKTSTHVYTGSCYLVLSMIPRTHMFERKQHAARHITAPQGKPWHSTALRFAAAL